MTAISDDESHHLGFAQVGSMSHWPLRRRPFTSLASGFPKGSRARKLRSVVIMSRMAGIGRQ